MSMQTSSEPIYGLSSVHRAIAAGLRTFASSASQLDLAVRSPQHQPSTLNCNTVITREVAARLERLSAQFQFLEALLLTHSVGEDAGIYVEQLNQEQQETNQRQQKQRTQHKQPQQPQHQEQQQQQQPPEEHNPHHHDGSEEEQWHIVGTMLRELHGDLRRNGALPCEKTRTLAEHAMGAANHIIGHMEEEERDILPKLARTCSHANQCKLVWKTLSSMHLRMLEQVLPWLAEHLSKHNMSSLVATVSCAVPPDDPLRALLSRWQEEHREPALEQQQQQQPSPSPSSPPPAPPAPPPSSSPPQAAATTTTASDDDESTRSAKRARTAKRANSEEPSTTGAANGTTTTKQEISETAIDHIFDIHKAILRELDSLSESASRLVMLGREHALSHAHAGGGGETASSPPQVRRFAGPQLDGDEEWLCKWDAALGDISGRFEYLRSFYEAHSKAEDDIVFPALESKKLLRNVFKSYQADHERESNLFQDLSTTITSLKTKREARRFLAAAANPDGVKLEHAEVANEEEAADADADATARQQLLHAPQEAAPHSPSDRTESPFFARDYPTRALHIKTLCSAIHASLSIHVRSEEQRIWPLFTKHFTTDEQVKLVGKIIGTTSADVLKTMLTLVGTKCGDRELREMIASWRRVSHSTRFEEWLSASKDKSEGSPKKLEGAEPAPTPSTAVVRKGIASETPGGWGRRADGRLGCEHYVRGCSLVVECCGKDGAEVVCKRCHDDNISRPCFPSKMEAIAVRKMVCLTCGERQPVAQNCQSCHTQMASYYCSICKVFDDDASPAAGSAAWDPTAPNEKSEHIYHCPYCNICRRGKGLGIDYWHCMRCNACFHMSLRETHKCQVQNTLDSACPICQDNLFESTESVVPLECGHALHSRCMTKLARQASGDIKCPVCRFIVLEQAREA